MGTHEQGFINGIYRDIAPDMGPADIRASLLRAVSKQLIRAGLDEDLRRKLISDLCADFGIELSEHGRWHFLSFPT